MNDNPKPIVVIDTQLVLRATLNERSLPAKILFDLGKHYILALSPEIRAEFDDVLNRPSIRAKFTTITDVVVERTLAVLDGGQQFVLEEIPPVSRDPKDDIFLATAVISGARYLVTEDKDLLVIGSHHGTRILNAVDFLQAIQP